MASHLSEEQTAHIAHLARLELSDAETKMYAGQLSAILSYVDQLESVDLSNVEPVAQVTGLVNVLQADEPAADTVDREAFLAGAPAAESPYVKVKAVLE